MKKEYKKSAYSEKLRDPRWQRKRLEILQRDDFSCQSCGDQESTLNVHHCYYSTGKLPWEYPDPSLVTLCESCHEAESSAPLDKSSLIDALSSKGLRGCHFNELMFSINLADCDRFDDYFISALSWAIENYPIREIITNSYALHLKNRGKNG